MGRYVKVDKRMHNDRKVRALSFPPSGRGLWFYMLFGDFTNQIGAYKFIPEGIAADLDWPIKAFREAFREVFQEGLIKYCEDGRLLFLPNFLKHNSPQSPNVVKNWFNAFDELPECPLKSEVYQHLKRYTDGMGEGYRDAFREAFGKGYRYTEDRDQITESDTDEKPIPEIKSPKTPVLDKTETDKAIDSVLEYLNKKTGRGFRLSTDKYRKALRARFNEGYTPDDCKKVVDIKAADPFFQQNPRYLNPETLFRPSNFDRYINEGPAKDDHLRGSYGAEKTKGRTVDDLLAEMEAEENGTGEKDDSET